MSNYKWLSPRRQEIKSNVIRKIILPKNHQSSIGSFAIYCVTAYM